MKVLFLDVDGVLNSRETFLRNHEAWQASGEPTKNPRTFGWPMGHLDETLIKRLNCICEKTNCSIVLSSSWRIISQLRDFGSWLQMKGFEYPHRLIDRTANLDLTGEENRRGMEIKDWLDRNTYRNISKYVILDDDCYDIINVHPKNLVHTNFVDGITEENVQQAIAILNN